MLYSTLLAMHLVIISAEVVVYPPGDDGLKWDLLLSSPLTSSSVLPKFLDMQWWSIWFSTVQLDDTQVTLCFLFCKPLPIVVHVA